MEVTRRDDHILVGEDIRIVGSRVDLVLDDAMHMRNGILDCPMYLRDAAERIWVLHVLFLPTDELAAFQQFGKTFCRHQLAGLRTQTMAMRIERLNPAVKRLQRDSTNHIRPLTQALRLDEAPHSVRTHELRAVQ